MAAVHNPTHPGTGPARGRIHELWATVVTALSGRRPAEEVSVAAPAPEVAAPQRPAEPAPADEQTGWPTWRHPR